MSNKSKKYRKIKSKRTSKKNNKNSSSKRYYHKKLIGYKKNYLGGTRLITMPEVTLSNMIAIYFNLYRLMPWQKDKLFIREDIKKELNNYCSRLQDQEIQSRCENVLNLQKPNENAGKESSNCCILNGKRKTSIYSIKKFTNNTQILIDDYDITFVKQYDAISINNKALEVEYKRKFIIDNWNSIDFTRLLKENLDTIQEIFDDYIIINNKFKNYDSLLDTIQSNSFFGIYDLFDLLTADGFVVIDEDFKRQLQIIKQRIQPTKTQEYDNKLFSQKLEDGTEIKYIYFSYGDLDKFYSIINHDDIGELFNLFVKASLSVYVDDITDFIQDKNVIKIVIAGHSIGSVIVQLLSMQLIDKGIDPTKLFIIGSGCCFNHVLKNEDIIRFKNWIGNNYSFILDGFTSSNNEVKVDFIENRFTGSDPNIINLINNSLLLCDSDREEYTFDKDQKYNVELLSLPATNLMLKGTYSRELHSFNTYSQLYQKYLSTLAYKT